MLWNRIFWVLVIGIGLRVSVWAQNSSVGVHGGGFLYTGDLVSASLGETIEPGVGVFYRYRLGALRSLRTNFSVGSLSGKDDINSGNILAVRRNASFDVQFAELSISFEYRFWPEVGFLDIYIPSMYIFGGIGGFLFTGYDESEVDFSTLQPVIPMGIGISYRLNRSWVIGIEASARKTFFDYIDNISGEDGVKDYQFGDNFSTDWYHSATFSLSYVIYSIKCPVDNTLEDVGYK